VGMDAVGVQRVSGLRASGWSAGRVQRQVHVQSARPPRRLVRVAALALASDVPQLLPAHGALAIQRDPLGSRSLSSTRARRRTRSRLATRERRADRLRREILRSRAREPRASIALTSSRSSMHGSRFRVADRRARLCPRVRKFEPDRDHFSIRVRTAGATSAVGCTPNSSPPSRPRAPGT